ncbi:toll/interleukin-1 receptor domain-containing protein [Gluconobacter sp. Dm-44]|uniref:toll/interleukin-1 receptor domain-containing protein n=1 Tax=Gluconobacter sp. Dm-44 TaxID=2799805 RepID=UPI001B8CB97F|nr:toll/interleukin-1 receptor domain-containing protein [Gluconobacter sp. Dm-44]MBS1060754.1 toll/interleukin-1 receptor domain-containing protein [Gluconobacter sp. Dm-44]
MKVFLSWSGKKSHEVAKLLQEWIACVIQSSDPWLSSNNIDAGSVWFSEIQTQLADTSIGIICLTNENKDKPWILFEAGALAKGISNNKVVVLLCDLSSSDIQPPLSQFNCITPDQQGMKRLFQAINSHSPSEFLKPTVLDATFEVFWEKFKDRLAKSISINQKSTQSPVRSDSDILKEILASTRGLSHRMNLLEENMISGNYKDESTAHIKAKKNAETPYKKNMTAKEIVEWVSNMSSIDEDVIWKKHVDE